MQKQPQSHVPYKYRINYLMGQLPNFKFRVAQRWLHVELGKSRSTLEKWMYVRQDEKLEIPADKLIMLARFFEVKPEEMFNTPPGETIRSDFEMLFENQEV
ncbi:MAG: hypothetical protein MK066_14045 [Crocinitomicaceae bacterium]|nr:hypothetical protein [Crocinitomicaceae bacterium]